MKKKKHSILFYLIASKVSTISGNQYFSFAAYVQSVQELKVLGAAIVYVDELALEKRLVHALMRSSDVQ